MYYTSFNTAEEIKLGASYKLPVKIYQLPDASCQIRQMQLKPQQQQQQ